MVLLGDGTEQYAISGEVDWEERVFNVPAGSHNFRWRYSKNSSAAVGLDRGWLDQVVFSPAVPMISSQPASQIADEGYAAAFGVAADGFPPLVYQWLLR